MLDKKIQHLAPPGNQWQEIYTAKSSLALYEIVSSGLALVLDIFLLILAPERLMSDDQLVKLGEVAIVIGFGLWMGYKCITSLLDFFVAPKTLQGVVQKVSPYATTTRNRHLFGSLQTIYGITVVDREVFLQHMSSNEKSPITVGQNIFVIYTPLRRTVIKIWGAING